MRSSIATGKAVSAYTASPSLAVLVEIACFSRNGTFVPAGISTTALLLERAATSELACPMHIADDKIRTTIHRIRIPRIGFFRDVLCGSEPFPPQGRAGVRTVAFRHAKTWRSGTRASTAP